MARRAQQLSGDFINAAFQGYYDRDLLKEEHMLQGTGIVLDDQFNFMLSHWRGTMLNGDSFVRTASGHTLYGSFEQNLPVGMMAVQREGLKIFISRAGLKSRAVEWHKEVAAIDTTTNVFYILELGKKDDQETTIDHKASNSESSRYDRVRLQWKIKILQRCPLKIDGTPSANSKLIKRYEKKIELKKGTFTTREMNEISLLASTLGNVFQRPALITPLAFLQNMALEDKKISLSRLKEINEEEETLLVSLDGKYSKQDKKLGMSLSLTYDYVKSLGTFSQSNRLSGLGVQYRKTGESFVGLFKQGLLSKQYKFNQQGSRNVSTFPIRELASQQHLKSLNYVHNCIYLPQIGNITAITGKIAKYIEAFEREYEKRNPSFNDTPSCQSISSETMNIYKYVDMTREKNEFLAISRPMFSNHSDREFKKPGFILNKSNNKSFEKSPPPKQPSPSLSPSKSPLKPVRITGKIYRETERSSSPSRSPLRNGQIQSYKRRY